MPTYEYQCDACEHQFEEFQSMSDEPLKKCPKCRKKRLRRLFGTGAALLFKGSGFYITDYRSESYKAAAKAEQDGSKSTSKEDSKASTNQSAGGKSSAESPKSSK
jgi:putative FmdB family regulatory protein